MAAEKTVELADLAATSHFGARLAGLLFPGSVVGLVGMLGAGKTHLVRAVAEGLGADGRLVTSPTFVLIQEYQARLPIYHFDAYRLASAGEFLDLGVNEYFEGQGVCLIEWADKVEACLPESWLRIGFTVTGPTSRLLSVKAHGARYESIIAQLS
jgi:tRNA threonylcarbamoyladenosine biosynthesis protein TsaE